MQNDFSFVVILEILKKRMGSFIIFGVLAAIGAYIASSPQFITPLYESRAVVYPSNLAPYSDESETEQLLQLFEANDIRMALCERFNLAERYDIDTTKKYWKTQLINEYEDKVSVQKTRFEAVEIVVMDQSPDTAQLMVQAIMDELNLKARRLQRSKSEEILRMFERFMDEQHAHFDSIETRMRYLGEEKGLLDYKKQTQEVTEGYMKMLATGRAGNGSRIAKELLENLAKHGGELKRLMETAEYSHEFYAEILNEYQNAINDTRKELTYINEVVVPEVPDKKSYPVRWLILFTAVFATELLLIIFFLAKGRLNS